jgi:hypothetical protein
MTKRVCELYVFPIGVGLMSLIMAAAIFITLAGLW